MNSFKDNDNNDKNQDRFNEPQSIENMLGDEKSSKINLNSYDYYDTTLTNLPKINFDDNNINRSIYMSQNIENKDLNLNTSKYNQVYDNSKNSNDIRNSYNSQYNDQNNNSNNNQSNDQNFTYNNQYNNLNNFKKVSKAPRVLGIIAGILAIFSIVGSSIGFGITFAITNSPYLEDLNMEELMQNQYVMSMAMSITLIWIIVAFIGIMSIIFAVISTKYVKASAIGFLICTILFFMLMFPGYGGSFLSFVLCLIASIICFKNLRNY